MFPPLTEMPGSIPPENMFGFRRKHDVHTGIDLFAPEGTPVYAMEMGRVIAIQWFTGEKVDMPWWENTQRILIAGTSGVIAYCEVTPLVKEGNVVTGGMEIAKVTRVLKKDKGRPMSMLHLEYYNHGYNRMWEKWELDGDRPEGLKSPMLLFEVKK